MQPTEHMQKMTRIYRFEAFDINGNPKWSEEIHNLTTTVGLNFINDTVFLGSAYTAEIAVGLAGATPTFAIGDTMASHSGWSEITAYTGNRPALTMAASVAGAATNTASKASFVFSAAATVGGAFIATNNTKGGTTGILIGGGALSGGDKPMLSGETLLITVTNTIS